VTELAWAHELRRRCWAERVRTVHLDSLDRANCELLLKGLQQSMDSGVLGPFRQLVERAMLLLQQECPVRPDVLCAAVCCCCVVVCYCVLLCATGCCCVAVLLCWCECYAVCRCVLLCCAAVLLCCWLLCAVF
jgi:hypothetical protein